MVAFVYGVMSAMPPLPAETTAPLPVDVDLAAKLAGCDKEACERLLGEPARKQQHYDPADIRADISVPTAEYWLYERAAIGERTGRTVDVQVWWDMSTGRVRKVAYYDPDSGEVLR